ncbi:MAG: cysteine dioxygenase [Candidatus Polarisedimenticolia bacterium]
MDPYAEIRGFIQFMDTLVSRQSAVDEAVQSVKKRLTDLIRSRPRLPEAARALETGCYARHLLYNDPAGRYEMIVMAWSPGQATPVHDHSGIWCVEGVIEGVIDVTRYDLTGMEGPRARMLEKEVIHAGSGECGALIPPLEYHRIANPYPRVAYSLHVYGGRMSSCRVFTPCGDGVYDVAVKPLGYTSSAPALPPPA